MNRFHRFARALAAAVTAAVGCLVVADTGSPPPPSLSEAPFVPVSRMQRRAFQGIVFPTYQAWLTASARTNTYPAFLLFLSTYPCSAADRVVYAHLYLEICPP